jgi:hypothetical protein
MVDWREELHPRHLGKFAAKEAAEESAALSTLARIHGDRAYRAQAADHPIVHEPTTPPPEGRAAYSPDVHKDENDDGIADRSRVGLGGRETCPPGEIPRLPNLTPEEREVESRFADAYERDPQAMVDAYRKVAESEHHVYNTDDAKLLSPDYNPPKELGLDKSAVNDMRSRNNVLVHQTANAVAKTAFLQRLDELPEGSQVLVTAGGCAAGKGFAIGHVEQAAALAPHVGATWDAAGEQNSTENPWILDECRARGLKPIFTFVDADPEARWSSDHPHGVLERAAGKGRMVDARLFADSYGEGAKNFAAFHAAHADDPDVGFILIDARTDSAVPRLLTDFPEAALHVDSDELYANVSRVVDEKLDVAPAIRRGATIGRRIWGGP